MVVDSSAIVAIILKEPGYQHLQERLEEAKKVVIAAPTLLECSIVLARCLDRDPSDLLSDFIWGNRAERIAFSFAHYELAVEAFLRYGKGRHPATLNFGDCMAYAVAKLADLPLLFTGDDFAKTDVLAA